MGVRSSDSYFDDLPSGQSKQIEVGYKVTDKGGLTANEKFYINIAGANDAPTLVGNSEPKHTFTTPRSEDTNAFNILSSDLLKGYKDVDTGDQLKVVGLTATNGTLTKIDDDTHTFKPDKDYVGTVDLDYYIIDGKGGIINAKIQSQ